MIVKNPKFEISAMNQNQYPQNGLPQIVLVGKSNVGKSSFVNTMINRKNLARTSNTPGKTRQVNFYNIDDTFYFVDLPGYGYNKMSKEEDKKVAASINAYLSLSKDISLVIVLIDIRHDLGNNDKIMIDYLVSSDLPFMVIANKADKIAKTKVADYVSNLNKDLNVNMLPFSAENKIYSEEVWQEIETRI